MKTKDFNDQSMSGFKTRPNAPRQQSRRPKEGMGLRAAFAGVLCVAGVFGVLGLLYTFG